MTVGVDIIDIRGSELNIILTHSRPQYEREMNGPASGNDCITEHLMLQYLEENKKPSTPHSIKI